MLFNVDNGKPGLAAMRRGLAGLILLLGLVLCMLASPAAYSQTQQAAPAATPSYDALADLLQDKQSRDALIKQLRSLAKESATAAPKQPAHTGKQQSGESGKAPKQGAADYSSVNGLVATIQSFTVSLSHDFQAMSQAFRNHGWSGAAYTKKLEAVPGLLAVIAATVLAFLALRAVASLFYGRLDNWVASLTGHLTAESKRVIEPSALYRKMGVILLAFLVDLCAVLLAAALGYAVVLYVVAHYQSAQAPGSVFVGAFAAVETACVLARVIFATRYKYLRLIRMSDDVARFWNGWLERLIRITGYGLLVAVPATEIVFLPAVGRLLGLFIMLGVYIYAVRVIWANRALLRQRLVTRAGEVSAPVISAFMRVLARIWHVLGIAYFTVLLIASQINPQDALPFMARATAQTLLAVGVGLLLSLMLTSLLSRRIRLSDELRTRLPMLEARVNAYVPAALRAARLAIMFIVALVVLDAWHAFNLPAWVESESGRTVIAMVVRVAIILLIAAFTWTVVASIIESRLSSIPGRRMPSEREKTLLSLFRNAALIVIVTMTVLIVLSQIGIDIGPLIAGAGVVGLAIGFGSQKLVQDVITGVFIQLENGMNQNDVVEICGLFGTVEKITIRSVVIRTLDGGYHLIPFSTVDKLTNHMRDFGYHYGEYNVGYRENADNVIAHLEHAFDELMQDAELAPYVLERISIPGVTSLTERGFTVRVLIKTVPGMQWMIQRGFNRLVKKHFDAAGIELPYPHSVLQFGRDKDGYVPPINVQPGPSEAAAPPGPDASGRQAPDAPAPESGPQGAG